MSMAHTRCARTIASPRNRYGNTCAPTPAWLNRGLGYTANKPSCRNNRRTRLGWIVCPSRRKVCVIHRTP
jgi:hypothetical protein